jgi:hypothetical protein
LDADGKIIRSGEGEDLQMRPSTGLLICRVTGGAAAHGAFRGDAQTGGDGVLTVRLFRVQKERPGLSVSFRGRRR